MMVSRTGLVFCVFCTLFAAFLLVAMGASVGDKTDGRTVLTDSENDTTGISVGDNETDDVPRGNNTTNGNKIDTSGKNKTTVATIGHNEVENGVSTDDNNIATEASIGNKNETKGVSTESSDKTNVTNPDSQNTTTTDESTSGTNKNQTLIVYRSEWGADPPTDKSYVKILPVPFVIFHHTYLPGFCNTSEECMKTMREIQQMHQKVRGWWDIGYNFCVGGTGKVYEGRGWDVQGAHAPRYNNKSTGICFIGDYREVLPTEEMLKAARELIQIGILRGSITEEYKLLGHRQVRETECPGDRFFEEIKTWDHWDPLVDIPTVKPPTTTTTTTQSPTTTSAQQNSSLYNS